MGRAAERRGFSEFEGPETDTVRETRTGRGKVDRVRWEGANVVLTEKKDLRKD